MVKICVVCGKKFERKKKWGTEYYKTKRTCCPECSKELRRIEGKGKYVKCEICGKEKYMTPSLLKRVKNDKYACSRECRAELMKILMDGREVWNKGKKEKVGDRIL